MAKEASECCGGKKDWSKGGNAGGGAVYGFGLFGALFFYLSNAGSFTDVLLGILKSLVWPAMMVYHLFTFLKL